MGFVLGKKNHPCSCRGDGKGGNRLRVADLGEKFVETLVGSFVHGNDASHILAVVDDALYGRFGHDIESLEAGFYVSENLVGDLLQDGGGTGELLNSQVFGIADVFGGLGVAETGNDLND